MDMKHSVELMPGRRGGDDEVPLDKILLPMKFSESIRLTGMAILAVNKTTADTARTPKMPTSTIAQRSPVSLKANR